MHGHSPSSALATPQRSSSLQPPPLRYSPMVASSSSSSPQQLYRDAAQHTSPAPAAAGLQQQQQQQAIDPLQTVKQTTHLVAVHKGITSLRSILYLEHMTSLRTVNLHMNQLTSLDRPIMSSACMRHVTDLDLSGNEVESMSEVQFLTELVSLNLASNRIRVVEGLSTLYRLERLSLSFNLLEDLLGLRQLPGESLKYIDVSGNLLPRVEALDALSHCDCLRELRVTIARGGMTEVSSRTTGKREAIDEGAAQLLDNPLVAVNDYAAYIVKLLPQLVLLDGRNVGFDPLQDRSSLMVSNSPLPPGGLPQEVSSNANNRAPPLPLCPESIRDQRVEEYLQGIKSQSGSSNTSPWQPSHISSGRIKRVSRSCQATVAVESVSCDTGDLPAAVVASTTTTTSDELAAVKQQRDALEEKLKETAALHQSLDEKHKRETQKIFHVLSAASSERDDFRRRYQELFESTTREDAHRRKEHDQLVAQLTTLKDQLKQSVEDAQRHQEFALRVQEDRLTAAFREREAHSREKWQKKLAAAEREWKATFETHQQTLHRDAMTQQEEAHRLVLASKERMIDALQREMTLQESRYAALDHQWTSLRRQEVQDMLRHCVLEESTSRRILEEHRKDIEHEWSLRRELVVMMIANDEAQQRRAKAAVTIISSGCQCDDENAHGTVTRVAVTQTEDKRNEEVCAQCTVLARRVLDLEAVALHQSETRKKDQVAVTELQDALDSLQQRIIDERASSAMEAESLTRTVENLKRSMSQQQSAHEAEIHEIEEECRSKIEEKRAVIHDLERLMDGEREKSQRLEEDLASAQDSLRSALAALQAQQRQPPQSQFTPADQQHYEKRIREMERREQEIKTQYQRLLDAVHTLRNQLVAVDTVNRSLLAKNEGLEARASELTGSLDTAKRRVETLESERVQLEREHRKIKENLRLLVSE